MKRNLKHMVAGMLVAGATILPGCINPLQKVDLESHLIQPPKERSLISSIGKYHGYHAEAYETNYHREKLVLVDYFQNQGVTAKLIATDFDGEGPREFEIDPSSIIPKNHKFNKYANDPHELRDIYNSLVNKKN